MGKLLFIFYLFTGVFCSVSVIISLAAGEVALSSWLVLAAVLNFVLFNIVWKHEQKRKAADKSTLVQI